MIGVINLIKGFFEFVVSIVNFVLKILQDLIYVVKILGQTVANLPTYLGFLPTTVLALFVGCLSIVVCYKVLGRS